MMRRERGRAEHRLHRGVPSGVTNCLNFGNPTTRRSTGSSARPCVAWVMPAVLDPVTGGNVPSFYNQTVSGENKSRCPCSHDPTIGMVGLLPTFPSA